ncbi:MAG TPA: hypothetical protein VNO35_18190 [Steroidobacteraceae bacterium]|jgi:hypothetical protein|nr:hypothetical protein [Steroidobacteraceae bacterium]
MAAKNKRTTVPGLHGRAMQHREDLLEEARGLRRDGKIGAAKGVEGRAQQVEQLVGALEGEARPADKSLN